MTIGGTRSTTTNKKLYLERAGLLAARIADSDSRQSIAPANILRVTSQ